MTALNKQALREAANAANTASWGKWESYKPHKGARGYEVKVGVKEVAQHCLKVDSVFIAAANPSTVLALLDELESVGRTLAVSHEAACSLVDENDELKRKLEAAENRIAELERYRTAFTEQHDKTDWVQHDKRFAIVRPLGKHRADVLREYIEHLEDRLKTADKLQDSAFRHGLQHGFSYGQTNDHSGYEQCLKSYSSIGKNNG